MFSIYGMITERSPELNHSTLEDMLRAYFAPVSGFEFEHEPDPFDITTHSFFLRWEKWWINVFYETGDIVLNDSREIAKRAGGDHAAVITSADRRIRVVFKSDPEKEYTNHILWMYEFLEGIPGLVLYDPQRNEWLN